MANRGVSRLTGIVLAASALFGGSGCVGVGMVGHTSNGTPVYWNMNMPVPVNQNDVAQTENPSNLNASSHKPNRIRLDGAWYTGSTLNWIPSGYGTLEFDNGIKYEGNFKKGKMHGQGKQTEISGEVYSGYWFNDEWVKTQEEFEKREREAETLANTKQR